MVESGVVDHEVLKKELQPFIEAKIDTLALGCTHFPFLRKDIQKIMGNDVEILDSGAAVGRQVQRILEKEHLLSTDTGVYKAYTTGNLAQFKSLLNRLGSKALHGKIHVEAIQI
jgi:glutamate racemase